MKPETCTRRCLPDWFPAFLIESLRELPHSFSRHPLSSTVAPTAVAVACRGGHPQTRIPPPHCLSMHPFLPDQMLSGACSVADRRSPGAWKSGKQRTLPTFPHPRLRRVISITRRVTLTIQLAQKIGQSKYLRGFSAQLWVIERKTRRLLSGMQRSWHKPAE